MNCNTCTRVHTNIFLPVQTADKGHRETLAGHGGLPPATQPSGDATEGPVQARPQPEQEVQADRAQPPGGQGHGQETRRPQQGPRQVPPPLPPFPQISPY